MNLSELSNYCHMETIKEGSTEDSFVFIVSFKALPYPTPFILKATWKTDCPYILELHESENYFHGTQCNVLERPLHVPCYAIFGSLVSYRMNVFKPPVRWKLVSGFTTNFPDKL